MKKVRDYMDEKNLIKRSLVDEILEVGKIENWLSNMAKRGIIIKYFLENKMYFEKGQPQRNLYRIAIFDPEKADMGKETYREHGWDFETKNDDYFIFKADEGSIYSEVPIIEEMKEHTLQHLRQYSEKINMSLVSAIFSTLGAFFILYSLFHNNRVTTMIIENSIIPFLCFPYYIATSWYTVMRKYRIASRYKQSILADHSFEHELKYKAGYLLRKANLILLIISIIYIFGTANFGVKEYSLDQSEQVLPVLRLADIEQDDHLVLDTNNPTMPLLGIDESDYNYVEKKSTFLAPTMYSLDEQGKVPAVDQEHQEYNPSLHVNYYALRSKMLAEPLIGDIINHDLIGFSEKDLIQANNQLADQVYYIDGKNVKYVILQRGNKVLYIRYYGKQKPEQIINAAIKKLSK